MDYRHVKTPRSRKAAAANAAQASALPRVMKSIFDELMPSLVGDKEPPHARQRAVNIKKRRGAY